EGIFCRRVKVDYASHSPQMDGLRGELLEAFAQIEPRQSSVPFYSTVTCERLTGKELGAEYWVRNMREPVQFSRVVSQLLGQGYRHFVELSPHPALATAMSSLLEATP